MERRSVVRFQRGIPVVCALILAGSVGIAPAQTPAQSLPPQQLDNLVAPIALYPDPLLGQVLAASTYPVELMEAQQWLQANGNLRGQQLMNAARGQNWDPSVQALVAMPDVMNLLTQDVHWTTDLGNAFLAQQGDVMAAVQRMRQRAQANGQLKSTPPRRRSLQRIRTGSRRSRFSRLIRRRFYVPAYDPYLRLRLMARLSSALPLSRWLAGSSRASISASTSVAGAAAGDLAAGDGAGVRTGSDASIFVNGAFFNRYGFHRGIGFAGGIAGRSTWMHDPAHRMGAAYPGSALSNRFGAASQASRIAAGRAGNWHSFGEGNIGAGNPVRSAAPGQAFRGQVNAQRFSSSPQRFSSSPQRFSESGNRLQAQAPAQRFQQAPMQQTQQRSAPAYQAPQRSFQSAPRAAAPSFGGGSRSFGGGGGGHSVSSGGSHSGGGHSGRR